MRSIVSLLLCSSLAAAPLAAAPGPEYRRLERAYWAFQPPKPTQPPTLPAEQQRWASTPIDAFVMAKLAEAGLRPAPEADRATLIRRAYFAVTGLPPSPSEIADFEADRSPDAWEKVVDGLLASPHFGERFGQQWLDVVRFAETEGFEYDRYLPGLWRYRDYVIQSFNEDKPYDAFLREQLAGDEMVEGEETSKRNQELLIAAGFHRLGAVRRNAGNQEVASSRNEVLTERTDIVGAAFLGLTVGCARCHDHKFDPIKHRDYYQLQAFLAAAEERDVPLGGAMTPAEWRDKTKELRGKLKNMRGKMQLLEGDELEQMEQEYAKLESELPPPPDNITTVTDDYENRSEIHILARGQYENKGERVDMRPLGVLLPEGAPTTPADAENPRLILANWFADPNHPLTARVMVNRIWSFYFGKGIVNTPNDFGFMGDRPSHPELLDYLAEALEDNGWRMKKIHKMILMSNAFRQASENPAVEKAGMAKDADNRLLWHAPLRRLSAEEVRDAMLAVSGKLNPKMFGESVIIPVDQALVDLLYDPTQWDVTADPNEHYRRSVYLIAKRNLRLPFMEVFDQPLAQTTCARREASTSAPQSLELLNGTISNDLARHFAERIEHEVGANKEQQVERAYLLAAGRMPTQAETKIARQFLETQPLSEFALAMFNLNAFLYVN
ncbi:MAG: DUF1549 and DUF1553 domain-containing protein [Bryobacterales bacterium]